MSETNWELKDRRIAWMNVNTACSTIIAARINAGLYKPKDNKEAMKELLAAISIEFEGFLSIGVGNPVGGEEKPPKEEKKEAVGAVVCGSCGLEVVSKKVRDYSLEHFGKVLCYDCQNKPGAEHD